MKKTISIIIITILLFSCLGLPVFAETPATISDDYQTLSMDGRSYSRVNTSMLEVDYYETLDEQIELSQAQQETVKEIRLEANAYRRNIVSAHITFYDGATLSVSFLQNDYLEKYNQIVSGQVQEYIIDFEWPEGNTVKAKKADILGNSVTLTDSDLEWCNYFYVTAQSDDGTLAAITGALIIVDNAYYYVDFAESSIEDGYSFNPYDHPELSAHEITNADLLSNIMDAEEKYYDDDLGFLYDNDLSETISAVFMILIFAIVPFVTFILFLILSIRSKTVYKKLFRTIYILSAAELVVFTIVAAFIIMN